MIRDDSLPSSHIIQSMNIHLYKGQLQVPLMVTAKKNIQQYKLKPFQIAPTKTIRNFE